MVFRQRLFSIFSHIADSKHPLKFIFGYFLLKLHLCRFFTITIHNAKFQFFPTKLSWLLWTDSELYDEELTFYSRFIKPGDTIIDAGANIGLISIISARLAGENGTILAIEPNPVIFAYMIKNIKINNLLNIRTVCAALGAHESSAFIDDDSYDDCRVSISSQGTIKVPIVTLDLLTRDFEKIALIKIDVEGFEKFVLNGAPETIQKTSCIIFESYEKHYNKFGYSCSDVFSLLQSAGYLLFFIRSDATISLIPDGYISLDCENLLAVKDLGDFIRRTNFSILTDQ